MKLGLFLDQYPFEPPLEQMPYPIVSAIEALGEYPVELAHADRRETLWKQEKFSALVSWMFECIRRRNERRKRGYFLKE